ncbi:TPA: hypothetical protein ACPY5T_002329 [Yersinia enterocolitica]
MNELNENNQLGKVAFIFPAKFDLKGANAPTLNFKANNNRVAMSVGISFVELKVDRGYLVSFTLTDPEGKEIITSTGMGGVPSEQIDPDFHTSFLSASFYFDVSINGTYHFYCHLIDLVHSTETPIDSKDILFNITNVEDKNV